MSTGVRTLQPADIPACGEILRQLPDWFGIAEANRAYVDSLEHAHAWVFEDSGRVVAFLALEERGPASVELTVMGVVPEMHRRGIGRELTTEAERFAIEQGYRWLHVMTRGPSTPDPGYERTRLFYEALGFERLFESLTLWGPEDAALVSVKKLAGDSTA